MNVQELIEILEKYDPQADVVLNDYVTEDTYTVSEVWYNSSYGVVIE